MVDEWVLNDRALSYASCQITSAGIKKTEIRPCLNKSVNHYHLPVICSAFVHSVSLS